MERGHSGRLRVRRGLGLTLGVVLVACSAIVSFDEDGQPCTRTGECLAGYSCLMGACVADESLSPGAACLLNQQCEGGAVCADFACRRRCSNVFAADGACEDTEVCVRALDPEQRPVGACVASNCSDDSDCLGEVCVHTTGMRGYCMDGCSVSCNAVGCLGQCVSNDEACYILGTNERAACLPADPLARHGTRCDLRDEFCSRAQTCVRNDGNGSGLCLDYCDVGIVGLCDGKTDFGGGLPPTECNPLGLAAVCGTVPPVLPPPGDSDNPGDSGPVVNQQCRERCDNASDCLAGHECVGNRCIVLCFQDTCTAQQSGWVTQCMDNTDCTVPDTVCVALASDSTAGRCALLNSAGCTVGQVAANAQQFEDSAPVLVCSKPAACRPDNGVCSIACDNNQDCIDRSGGFLPVCNPSGFCVQCLADVDCDMVAGKSRCVNEICGCNGDNECPMEFPVCRMNDGQCGCTGSSMCTGNPTGDVCRITNVCGCSTVADCSAPRVHPGTTQICQ